MIWYDMGKVGGHSNQGPRSACGRLTSWGATTLRGSTTAATDWVQATTGLWIYPTATWVCAPWTSWRSPEDSRRTPPTSGTFVNGQTSPCLHFSLGMPTVCACVPMYYTYVHVVAQILRFLCQEGVACGCYTQVIKEAPLVALYLLATSDSIMWQCRGFSLQWLRVTCHILSHWARGSPQPCVNPLYMYVL